jgi:hypothetical protein
LRAKKPRSWTNEYVRHGRQTLLAALEIATGKHFVPWIEKVIHQTQQPVWGGDTHVEDQLLSLFETHTQVIRKGKAHKPDEFGRLVRIDEVENGMVSGYQVLEGNPDDTTAWVPALKQHQLASGERRRWPPATAGFFCPEPAGGASPGRAEGGAAGSRTAIDRAGPEAEAALVPTSTALAGRL